MVQIICIDCGESVERCNKQAKRCWGCSDKRARQLSRECRARRLAGIPPIKKRPLDIRWKNFAAHGVAFGKAIGLIRPLDGSVPCVDCGATAEVYDHRDYTRPLDVDPVCMCCNAKRGSAYVPDIFGKPSKKEAA